MDDFHAMLISPHGRFRSSGEDEALPYRERRRDDQSKLNRLLNKSAKIHSLQRPIHLSHVLDILGDKLHRVIF